MRRKKKTNILLILFAVICLFGIGYAYLTTTLSINGVTEVDSNSWNVYWNNVVVTTGSVTGSQVITAPTINTGKTSVSFNVRLSRPGDYYEFTVDVKNDGTIDAMIDTISKTTNIPSYLNYTVTYVDGIEIVENQLLAANTQETYKVRVEYRTDINASDLPISAQSLNLTFSVTYVQGDDTAVKVRPLTGTIYRWSTIPLANKGSSATCAKTIESLKKNVDFITEDDYPTYGLRSAAIGKTYYLKHTIVNDEVIKSYICFITDEEICMQEGSYENYNSNTDILVETKPWFESHSGSCSSGPGLYTCNGGGYYNVLSDMYGVAEVDETSSKGCSVSHNTYSVCKE